MEKERLPAFTDGVIAVIITIMILEMKVPQDASLGSLRSVIPVFLSYVLSFVYVAIYWNNHHHFFHLVRHVNGGMLWANINLLFWVSLVPFGRGRPASRTKPTRPSLTPASRTSSTAGGEQSAASSPTITSLSRGRANVAQRSFSLDPPVRPGFPRTAYGRLPRLATGSSLSITGLSRQPLDQALQRSLALRVQSRTLDPDLGRDHRRTVRTCAATNPGSGAARKATALAISSRRPVRPLQMVTSVG